MTALDKARAIIADALGLPPEQVPPDASMETLPEWDSIGHVRIVLSVETAIGRPLQSDAMLRAIDVLSVAELLD
jgi:acyl carrier protein